MENKENTKPKFTPGPWSIEKSEYPDGAGYCYINAKDKNIGGDVIVFQGINNMANAALIAAAPEMYALLSNILNDLETDGIISLNDNAANDIQMLLAKARGEECDAE